MKRLTFLAVAALAAGCAQTTGAVPSAPVAPVAPAVPSAIVPTAPTALGRATAGVFVGQANGSFNGFVFGFKAQDKTNQPPLCTIGNQNFGDTQIGADAAGNIYIPNAFTGVIRVYAPNCGALVRTIADPYDATSDVTVHGSTIYATGGTKVAVCTSAGCSSALTDPSIFQLETAAVDSRGNVWASYYAQKGPISLIVWRGGAMPGRVVNGYVNQNTPGDLIFDKNDTLVSIQTRFTHAYVYRCNAATASCTNTKIVSLHGSSLFGALNSRNTNIQLTNYSNQAVDVYGYPSFAYQYSYSQGFMQNYAIEGIVQTQ